MEAFKSITGIAAALPHANLDTDQIMPKQFLRGIDRIGLSNGLLFDLRFVGPGQPRQEFVLNQAPWNKAAILIAGPNFGCGSSREHAVWGLRELGIRCVIAASFGGIFGDNCSRNGVPAIIVAQAEVDRLMALASAPSTCTMTVDLERQVIVTPADGEELHFAFDLLRRHMLLEGLDAVGLTMQHAQDIRAFERRHLESQPWLA